MIKSFKDYIFESESMDSQMMNLMSSLARNYDVKQAFYTDNLQFIIREERREWTNLRKQVELLKPKTEIAYYKLRFDLDEKYYVIEINYKITFTGKSEKDAPNDDYDKESDNRYSVALDDVKINSIKVESDQFNYDSKGKRISIGIIDNTIIFINKMMSIDYDVLGNEMSSLQQKI